MAKAPVVAQEKKKGPSAIVQIVVFLALSAMAGGAGWGMGQFMQPKNAADASASESPAEGGHEVAAVAPDAHGAAPANAAAGGHGEAAKADGEHGEGAAPALVGNALLLDPIVTNLASPQDVWVRLEMALVVDAPLELEMTQAVQQDIFGYIRTVRLSQLEGPSGFLNLKSDILDRAKIRSTGKVKGILIKTMLFE